jgi:hypothetical protein
MALIVQDDTGTVANANGYISVAAFKTYHDDRGNDYSDFDDTAIASGIIKATDYIDTSRKYKYWKLTEDQTTEFPRECLGYPANLLKACAEYALRACSAPLAPDLERNAERIVSTMQKVGPLEERTSYLQTGSGSRLLMVYPAADMLLKDLIDSSVATRVIR